MPAAATRGRSPYGSVPVLPTGNQLQSNMSGILEQAIPGYSGLSRQATGIVGDALSGRLPSDVQNVIQNAAATQAVANGMPGSSNRAGSLYGNKTLRDLGLTSLGRQDQGFKDFLSLLTGSSGVTAPTFGQAQEQANAAAQYAGAPDPEAAFKEQERLFNQYSNPARGTLGGAGGADVGNTNYDRRRDSRYWGDMLSSRAVTASSI